MSFDTPVLLLLLPVMVGWTVWLWARRLHGRRTTRRLVSLVLRLLVFAALILAAAGMTLERPTGSQAVAFVADVSASTESGQPDIVRFIDSALHVRGSSDIASIVATGQSSVVEQPPAPLTGFQQFESVVNPDYTNLESGLALGGALLPSSDRRRVVLLSDGQENLGDAVNEAQLLQSEGVRVDTVAVSTQAGPEVRVDSLAIPADVRQGEQFTIVADVHSTVRTATSYQVFQDGQLAGSGTAAIQVGETAINRTFRAGSAGVHTYTIVLQPQEDTLSENNQASAFTTVSGPAPRAGSRRHARRGQQRRRVDSRRAPDGRRYRGRRGDVGPFRAPALCLHRARRRVGGRAGLGYDGSDTFVRGRPRPRPRGHRR